MSENDQNLNPDPTDSAESTESADSGVKQTHLRSRVLLIIGIVILAILLIGGGLVLGALRQLRGEVVLRSVPPQPLKVLKASGIERIAKLEEERSLVHET